MGQGLRLRPVEGRYHLDDQQHALAPDAQSRLLSHKQRDVLLEACAMQGPIFPACPICETMQYWHNHTTDGWACWACVPPVALPDIRKETHG